MASLEPEPPEPAHPPAAPAGGGFLSYLRLPALPSLSLPSHLQSRLLSFLLHRTVGHYLSSTIDISSLSSDLAKGSASLSRVELSCEAINPLLSSTPFILKRGTISLLAAQLSFSSIEVKVKDVAIVLALAPGTTGAPSSDPPTQPRHRRASRGDLAESMLSVVESAAQEFAEEDREGAGDDEDDEDEGSEWGGLPGGFGHATTAGGVADEGGDGGGPIQPEEKVSMLAGVIERIVTKLGVEVENVVVTVEIGGGGSLEGKVEKIAYGSVGGEEGDGIGVGLAKEVKVSGVEGWLLAPFVATEKEAPTAEERPPAAFLKPSTPILDSLPTRTSHLRESTPLNNTSHPAKFDADSSSSEEEDVTDHDDLAMSQSIADLRESTASLSIYASAQGSTIGSISGSVISTGSTSSDSYSDDDGGTPRPADDEEDLNPFSNPDISAPSPPHPSLSQARQTLTPTPRHFIPPSLPHLSTASDATPTSTSSRSHESLPPRRHQIFSLSRSDTIVSLTPSRISVSGLHPLLLLDLHDVEVLLQVSSDVAAALPSSLSTSPPPAAAPKAVQISIVAEEASALLNLYPSPPASSGNVRFEQRFHNPGAEWLRLDLEQMELDSGGVGLGNVSLWSSAQQEVVLAPTPPRGQGEEVNEPGEIRYDIETSTLHLPHYTVQLSLPFLESLLPLLSIPTPSRAALESPHSPTSTSSSTATLPTSSPLDLLSDLETMGTDEGLGMGRKRGFEVVSDGVSVVLGAKRGKVGVALGRFGMEGGAIWIETLEGWWSSPPLERPTTRATFLRLSSHPSSTPTASSSSPPISVSSTDGVRIPKALVKLEKTVLDGLVLLADELATWSSGLEIGQKKPLESHGKEDSGDGNGEESKWELWVEEVEVELTVPTPKGESRKIVAKLEDIEVGFLKPSLTLQVRITDILLTLDSEPLLARTLARNRSVPLLLLRLQLPENRIDLALSNFTASVNSGEIGWVEDVGAFLKSPEGAFEGLPPSERTILRVNFHDASIRLTPPHLSSALVIHLSQVKTAVDIVKDTPTKLGVRGKGVKVFAVEGKGDLLEGKAGAGDGAAFWKSMGHVQIVNIEATTVEARLGLPGQLPSVNASVADTKVTLAICADTLPTVGAFAADFASAFVPLVKADTPPPPSLEPARHIPVKKQSQDLLSSVDPRAFHGAPSLHDMPEYLDDDVPTNIDYLADALRTQTDSPPHGRQSRKDLQAGRIISDIDGETIRMLDPNGVNIVDGFLAEPRVDPMEDPTDQPPSVISCRVHRCDVTIHIHEGFDWETTRKAIQDEAKRVRRRLEKIRQLLASGQAADASVEDTSVLLFGSVQLGLPPGASELPASQLLAAIDEELQEGQETASNAESWQSLPGQTSQRRQASVGRGRSRLTRSPAYAIEINLRDVSTTFDSFLPTSQLASRLRVDVASFDIIDNIRTSTWRKFLTELRPSDGGVVRESGASMARFELNKVRPVNGNSVSSLQEEILMKIKIFPLRLYIDQDALDFLKSFGAFRMPSPTGGLPEAAEPLPANEPFFQRVEILPVKIKLDYKPKRVDYHALRQGKTAELMNFFHFDGSEMTLRHLVVTGVSGSTRLSDLVQDIWTPDVKANQLADVISGIAPVRSVVNLGSGVANLVLLPIEQYRKDGRIARGLQRGVQSFSRTTTLEALNVGARLATGTQVILEQAENVLGARFAGPMTTESLAATPSGEPGDSELSDEERQELISRYAEQPGDLREGMESAYRSLGDNFRSAAQTILAVPMEVYERSGNEGPVRAVVRAVPVAVLRPMIGATEAVSKALFGLRNSLDPNAQAEQSDKYKSRSPSS